MKDEGETLDRDPALDGRQTDVAAEVTARQLHIGEPIIGSLARGCEIGTHTDHVEHASTCGDQRAVLAALVPACSTVSPSAPVITSPVRGVDG